MASELRRRHDQRGIRLIELGLQCLDFVGAAALAKIGQLCRRACLLRLGCSGADVFAVGVEGIQRLIALNGIAALNLQRFQLPPRGRRQVNQIHFGIPCPTAWGVVKAAAQPGCCHGGQKWREEEAMTCLHALVVNRLTRAEPLEYEPDMGHSLSAVAMLKPWIALMGKDVMEDRVRELLQQITRLEDELRQTLASGEQKMFFQLHGKRIEFESAVKARHRQLRMGWLRWLVTSRPQNWLSAPFIYAVFIPFVLLDIFVSVYHAVCFPLYGIPKVPRADYFAFDRQHLGYLNWLEKLNCTYCAYGNGLLAWVTEVTARTEQYWCPIKHAHKVLGTHLRYPRFAAFGDGENYHAELNALRKDFRREAREAASQRGEGDQSGS